VVQYVPYGEPLTESSETPITLKVEFNMFALWPEEFFQPTKTSAAVA